MKSIFLARNGKRCGVSQWVKRLFLFLLTSACLTSSILAGEVGQASLPDMINYSQDSQGIRNGAMTSRDACPTRNGIMTSGDACPTRNGVMTSGDACPTREELITKTKTLQMPFIANNGQTDEQVAFYAKTFGGTVFVTKDGEIVYSLPSGRDVPAGASPSPSPSQEAHGDALGSMGVGERRSMGRKAVFGWHGQAPLVRAESEFVVANAFLPLFSADNAYCPPARVLTNALLAAYLPGLQKETTQRVVSTSANNNPHSKIQNPQSPMRGVALKEQLVGGKINEMKGGTLSVTKVSYFKGNDPSKWKSTISAYEVVDMGEVYKGIGLKLRAYGNNVEKLFTVTPDANPDVINVVISGAMALSVNEDGQLVAETALGPVRFTKPVAYQEIEGKRVAVECKYTIAERGVQHAEYKTNPQSSIPNPKLTNSDSPIPHSEYGFTVASYDKTKDLIIDPCWHPRTWVGMVLVVRAKWVILSPSTQAGMSM